MERITLVLKSGMGMQLDAIRPYLRPGMPIAIGRAGAVIAEVAEGNAIEDKRQAAEAAAGYIDSVERYVESANTLDGAVSGLESTLQSIEQYAEDGQNGSALQAMNALRVIRETVAKHLASAEGAGEIPLERALLALRTIAEFPCPEQDNMPAANMRQIALAALSGAGVSTEPGNPGGEPVSGPGNTGEPPGPAPRPGDDSLGESLRTLERWLDRVAIEDGYVGVPVIEAVEVVVTEMKRQQQPVDPAFCRCNHWFAGDSVEAAFIRQHGQCQDCVEMDQMLEREVQAENAKRYLWLRNTALYASDLAREVNRMDKSVVNLFPRDKDGNLLAEADLDEAIDAAMAKPPEGGDA